jgi:hypothetical protein
MPKKNAIAASLALALVARVNELSRAQNLDPIRPEDYEDGATPAQPSTPEESVDLDALEFREGMSEPDEFGAVILEDLERRVRPDIDQELEARNLKMHQRHFVEAAGDVWDDRLNDVQRAHITMNTGDNAKPYAAGRFGRAVKVEQVNQRGRLQWREVDTLPNHGTTIGPSAAKAVAEIERSMRKAIADAVDNGGSFGGRRG